MSINLRSGAFKPGLARLQLFPRLTRASVELVEPGGPMIKLAQLVVMFAVLSSNAHWQWIRNFYVATLIAILVTAVATALLVATRNLTGQWPRTDRRHWLNGHISPTAANRTAEPAGGSRNKSPF